MSAGQDGPSVLVVVPTRNTAQTLPEAIRRIPKGLADDVLVVDNGSRDASADVAEGLGLRVVRHHLDRGYGASQKTAFSYAIAVRASVLAVLHSDLQYPPELLPEVVAPILAGDADAVLGSRVMSHQALAGGMPRYKYVGNRVLTYVENRVLGSSLSEFHTGCRAYSVAMLGALPYFRNSDGWLFDSEILFQVLAKNQRVVELSVPCIYDGNSSSVPFADGIVYGLGVLALCGKYALHRSGLWSDSRFR